MPTLLVAAAAWVAAGPGGVTLQAIAVCRHHRPAGVAHHGHDAKLPPGTPCFCDEMTGGSDVALAPAVPAPAAIPVLVAGAEGAMLVPLPPSPFPGFIAAPIPPPPNPLA